MSANLTLCMKPFYAYVSKDLKIAKMQKLKKT